MTLIENLPRQKLACLKPICLKSNCPFKEPQRLLALPL